MAEPLISAIICTYNRSGYARKAVLSLLDQTMPADAYEVIVVDNNSGDDSRQVIQAIDDSRVRYVFEPRQGLSHARNRGCQEASARYVAFLDDDATAAPAWLEAALRPFREEDPAPGVVGGPIRLAWEKPEPHWISQVMRNELGALDWGDRGRQITAQEWLCGGNMALCREALTKVGRFPSSLGRSGNRQATYEETFVVRRLQEAGGRCWYEPDMLIHHTVMADRIAHGWFRERFHTKGRSLASMELLEGNIGYGQRLRRAWRTTWELLRDGESLRAFFTTGRTPDDFERKFHVLFDLGYIRRMLGI